MNAADHMHVDDLLIRSLDNLDCSDPERAHGQAEDLIRDWMPEEVRQAYDRLVRRCPWWATA